MILQLMNATDTYVSVRVNRCKRMSKRKKNLARPITQPIQSFTGGGQKKVAPHQKWFTWIIMAINKENVNKTNVVVFTCVAVCKPKQYL